MTEVHDHECRSWLANNPLHVLAAFGAFLLTDDELPGRARLSWRSTPRGWMPVVHAPIETAAWCEVLARRLRDAGTTKQAGAEDRRASQRAVADAKSAAKKQSLVVKATIQSAKQRAKEKGLKAAEARAFVEETAARERTEESRLEAVLSAAQETLADELGAGPAHLGAVAGVGVALFRRKATAALAQGDGGRIEARQLAALASDGCRAEGDQVQPTPLSFSNGASGQMLLKDFRALTELVSESRLSSVIGGTPELLVATSLNWDPAGQRNYALQWGDPGDSKSQPAIDVVTNALAYMGLGLLTAVPTLRALTVAGFANKAWTWPVWETPLAVPVVASLLASPRWVEARPAREGLERLGVVEVMRSERLSINKRYFFAPATAV